jgi:hypothetical protein
VYTKHVHSGTGAVAAGFPKAAAAKAHSARKFTSGLRRWPPRFKLNLPFTLL